MFENVAVGSLPELDEATDQDEAWLARLIAADPGDPAPSPEPVRWSAVVPSGWLALELDSITADPVGSSDADLVDHIVGWERVVSWAQARQVRALAEFTRRRPADHAPGARRSATGSVMSEFAADEVALALHLARGPAAELLTFARTVERVLPGVVAAWETGSITRHKAQIIAEAVAGLPDDTARAVAGRVLPRAASQTPTLLRRSVHRAVLAADPHRGADRADAARARRRVAHRAEPDAMGSLWALLPAADAVAAWTRLSVLARGLGADDPRSMDARRADLLADLLTGRGCAARHPCPCPCQHRDTGTGAGADTHDDTSAARRARACPGLKPLVQVTVPITTLLGLDDAPADLAGHGPIPAHVAREIATDGTWRRLLTDPATGTVLDHGRTTYTPPRALADHVRARDTTCRHPGCTTPATSPTVDLDHTVPHPHGTTAATNLTALCRHHHRLKTHAPRWHVTHHPDGTLTWRTPTGHTHTTRPHDHRPEEPFDDPPPVPPPAPTRPTPPALPDQPPF